MSFLPYGGSGTTSWLAAMGSSVVVHGVTVALALGGLEGLLIPAAQPAPPPAYTITLERLDSDTLAGLLERHGEAGGSEDAGGNATEAPQDGGGEPEQITALPPQEEPEPPVEPDEAAEVPAPETPEPETPEAQTPEAVQPETVTTAEPAGAESITALDPVTPEAGEVIAAPPREALDPGPLVAETVVPISPLDGTATALSPVAPLPGTGGGVAPLAPQVETLAPSRLSAGEGAQIVTALNTRPAQPSAPVGTRPAAQPAPPPSAQDLAIGDLIARIRATPADECLIALPRRDGADGVGLALVAASDAAMAAFAEALLTPEDTAIRQTRTLIDPRQCAALSYVRESRDYPATRLGVALDSADVLTGDRLTGVLRGVAGRYVLVLLVDNNGVVQDLQRFISFSGNFARLDVPVTRAGPLRDTSQLLLAIATDRPPATIRTRDGRLAADVFDGLAGEEASPPALTIATFDVR